MAKDQETEEGRHEEQEKETVLDTEMEQQAGNQEEARGGLNWEKLMELMSSMKEQNKQTNEKIDSIKAVSYTHLDVYKRQTTSVFFSKRISDLSKIMLIIYKTRLRRR